MKALLAAVLGLFLIASCTPPASGTVGTQSPDVTLRTMEGQTIKLSERLTGKPTIINFWATWCVPCITEMPELEAAAKRHPNIQVLAIDQQEEVERVKAFLAEENINLPILLDPTGETQRAFRVRGLPTSVFVNKDGKITAVHVGQLNRDSIEKYVSGM